MTSVTFSSIRHFSSFNVIANPSRKVSLKKGFNALPLAIRSTLSDDFTPLLDAAKHTVDPYVESGMVIGLRSGRASSFAIQYLGQRLLSGAVKDVVGVPTCTAVIASEDGLLTVDNTLGLKGSKV